MLVGLLVVLPAINYSIYAAYHDIYLEDQEAEEGETPVKAFGFKKPDRHRMEQRGAARPLVGLAGIRERGRASLPQGDRPPSAHEKVEEAAQQGDICLRVP